MRTGKVKNDPFDQASEWEKLGLKHGEFASGNKVLYM